MNYRTPSPGPLDIDTNDPTTPPDHRVPHIDVEPPTPGIDKPFKDYPDDGDDADDGGDPNGSNPHEMLSEQQMLMYGENMSASSLSTFAAFLHDHLYETRGGYSQQQVANTTQTKMNVSTSFPTR